MGVNRRNEREKARGRRLRRHVPDEGKDGPSSRQPASKEPPEDEGKRRVAERLRQQDA